MNILALLPCTQAPCVHVSYTHLSRAQVPRSQLCVHLCPGNKAFDPDEVVETEKAEWNGEKCNLLAPTSFECDSEASCPIGLNPNSLLQWMSRR